MKLSTKVAIACGVAWFVLNLIASAVGPSSKEEFFRQSPSEAESMIATVNLFQGLANLSLLAAVVSILVTAYGRIIGKQTPHVTNVGGHQITATHGATVATDNARVDQSTNMVDSSLVLSMSDEQMRAVRELGQAIAGSQVPADRKRQAELIVSSVERARSDGGDLSRVRSYLSDLASIVESAKPLAESAAAALQVVRSLLGS